MNFSFDGDQRKSLFLNRKISDFLTWTQRYAALPQGKEEGENWLIRV